MVEFSLCLLFAKLVSYTFLYWLPLYIVNVGEFLGTGRRERAWRGEHLLTPLLSLAAHFGAKEAGDLSTLFDVGGILGSSRTRGGAGWWSGDDLGTILALIESPLHG